MTSGLPRLYVNTPALVLEADLVPWDMEAFGFPVAQIHELQITDDAGALSAYHGFHDWLDTHDVKVASCRLPEDRLRESFFLESQGFRFIEMVLHPHLDLTAAPDLPADTLDAAPADEGDMATLEAMAERAFRYERYHVDPRLDPQLGQRRYGRWVRTSLSHPRQRLLKILDGGRIVAFFLTEAREDGRVYWHLNAVAPEVQGQGYGRRAWLTMLRWHREAGAPLVSTTISARNVVVLNLYARLGFRFLPPEMTFHWVRGTA